MFLMSVNGVATSKDANPQSPRFEIENSYRSVSSHAGDSGFLLLQFWDASDASSRIKAATLSARLRTAPVAGMSYAGVYTGSDRNLFNAVAAADGMDLRNQFMLSESADADNIFAEFSLSTGNHTFLINPQGRIAAINPSMEEIEAIVARG